MEIVNLTLYELRQKIRDGELSVCEVLEALGERIAATDSTVGAYLDYNIERALSEARNVDLSLPLGGLPIAIKDNINVKGELCTCASKILTGYRAPYDATAIARLKSAGAIPFGRLNMDEFAMGSSTENSAYQLTRNPWDPSRIPGGSSGGSAASVAARSAFAALGSDTGGSIRQPAAHCGCVGLKPSYGRVSRYGLVAFASSLDQIGPLARSVRDCALLLSVIAGHDPADSTSLDAPVPDYTANLREDLRGIRLGIPKEYFSEGIDSHVRSCIETALQHCKELGAEIVEISLPHTPYAISTYYIIAPAEASANLARFDGVRYGYRTANPADISELYFNTRAEGFGSEVKRRIILGTYVLSSGYYDAYYLRAQKVRTLIRRDFEQAFQSVDAIVCPTSPEPAFPIGERTSDPLKMYLSDIFTISANLAGICAISVPCGFAQINGKKLPVGLQFLCNFLEEQKLLSIANAYEVTTPWSRQSPPI